MPALLFKEPFDLNDIDRVLQDEDFLAIVHFSTGLEENWRDALDQTARLLSLFEENKRDDRHLYQVVSILVSRARYFRTLDEINSKLNLMVNRTA